jgi:restriction endonuclease Mrr
MRDSSELKPLPSETEVIAELEDYLTKAHRPVTSSEAYLALADRFGLTREQQTRLMPDGRVHWENRVQFARRKLKDAGKLDVSQPRGKWAIKRR